MTLRRKLILISLNFEKYILYNTLYGRDICNQTWDVILLEPYVGRQFDSNEHGLSTYFYKVLNQAQGMFKDALDIVTATGNVKPYGGHTHINN